MGLWQSSIQLKLEVFIKTLEGILSICSLAGTEHQIENAKWHEMRVPKILYTHIISNF